MSRCSAKQGWALGLLLCVGLLTDQRAAADAAPALESQDVATGPLPTDETGSAGIDVSSAQTDPCRRFRPDSESWLDRSQVGLYESVCVTAAWFDGFFGDARYDQQTGETYGRISPGFVYDERDGFEPRLRFRARFALPSMREGGNFFLGRGDERQLVEGRDVNRGDDLAPVVGQPDDDALFAGFGLRQTKRAKRGFDLDLGVKVRLPPDPFVRASYRYGIDLPADSQLRLQPLVYWKLEEKFGASLGVDLDHAISEAFLLRWANRGNVSQDEDIEGVAWGSSLTLYQALTNRRALFYSVFVQGETDADVQLQNYGYEMRYRQRILRKWLFVEYLARISWPREFPDEQRETNLGVGLRFEAYFGPTPDNQLR